MAIEPDMPRNKRNTRIAAIMLVVLLLSIGAAEVLVLLKGADQRSGAQILTDIRSSKLPAFWGEQDEESWYLITEADGQAAGWSLSLRRRVEGGYRGDDHTVSTSGTQISVSWRINDGVTEGDYRDEILSPSLPTGKLKTRIVLENEKLTVASSEYPQAAADEALPNYIPEGTFNLLVHQAGLSGKSVTFKRVFPFTAIQGGRVNFTPIRIVPQDSGVVRVSSIYFKRLYTFDDAGRLDRIEDMKDGQVWQRVSREKVAEFFPEVGAIPDMQMPSEDPLNPDADNQPSGEPGQPRVRARGPAI